MSEDLAYLRKKGLLIGPYETYEEAIKRWNHLQSIKPLFFHHSLFKIEQAFAHLKKKRPLVPWVGALTDFNEENKVIVPTITLGPLANEEMIDHELLHALRATFEDSIYEEFFAYENSKGLRKKLGPLFTYPWQAHALAILIIFSLFTSYALIFSCSFLGYLFIRLFQKNRIYKKALKAISKLFSTSSTLPIMLHLTDEEIVFFAKNSIDIVKNYILTNQTLRMQQLKHSFQIT